MSDRADRILRELVDKVSSLATRASGVLGEIDEALNPARDYLDNRGEVPADPPSARVPVIWNPHLLPQEDRFQFPDWADLRSWHLSDPEMPDGIGPEETQRRIDATRKILAGLPEGTQLSTDGLLGAWPDRIKQYVLAFLGRPAQGWAAHTEYWDRQLNRASWDAGWKLGSISEGRTEKFLESAARRAESSLRFNRVDGLHHEASVLEFPLADIASLSLRAVSPIYGVLCAQKIDPFEVAEWVRGTGANMMRVWAVSQWEGQGSKNIHPWGAGNSPWNSGRLSDWWQVRFDDFAGYCASIGLALQVVIFDWAGVRNKRKRGHWPHSPYNRDNGGPVDIVEGQEYPAAIMSDVSARGMTSELAHFIGRMAAEHGNIVIDPVNEPGRLGPDYADAELEFAADIVGWASRGYEAEVSRGGS